MLLVIDNEMQNCQAVQTLSPGAFRVLVDFTGAWNKRVATGRSTESGMRFSWASDCRWVVQETAWRGYRTELEIAGFLEVVNAKTGFFRLSDAWRSRDVGITKLERFRRVEAAKARRAAKERAVLSVWLPLSICQ